MAERVVVAVERRLVDDGLVPGARRAAGRDGERVEALILDPVGAQGPAERRRGRGLPVGTNERGLTLN